MDWFKFLLILAAVSLFIKIEGETSNVTGLYNACYIDRFAPNTMIPYTSIAEWVWKLTQACIVALMLQLCLWRDTDVFFPFEVRSSDRALFSPSYLVTIQMTILQCFT